MTSSQVALGVQLLLALKHGAVCRLTSAMVRCSAARECCASPVSWPASWLWLSFLLQLQVCHIIVPLSTPVKQA